jgi:aminomethyltransferase
MKKTPLYEAHVDLGAKMAPFGGYDMPIQYEGIIAEHNATRQGATVFDTCHMGEFRITGATAVADLERLISAPIGSMETGQCRYGLFCNEAGGVIDDEITYRMGPEEFMIVVNAGTQEQDFEWILSKVSAGTKVENLSEATAKLDVQGPGAPKIVQAMLEQALAGMKYYRFAENRYRGERVLVSRTGYTGEIGFEIYCPSEMARTMWDDCLSRGIKPAGLGARDTLRLEMGYPLYGHELSADRNAAESGFERSIASDKDFVGSSVVLDPGTSRERLVGLLFAERRAARQGDAVLNAQGEHIGTVTSGSFGPSVGTAVAMAYVKKELAVSGTSVQVSTGRATLWAKVHDVPFYAEATARKALAGFLG